MEMMESIKLPDLALEKKGPCPYCEEEPSSDKIENKEVESPLSPEGMDEGPENSETNDASLLGAALKNRPTWKISHKVDDEDPIKQGQKTDIVPAAHHLLPGNASVKNATALHKYMLWQGKNELGLSGPIGYDINNEQNGVWLPGNYAVREWTGPKDDRRKTEWGKNWSKFGDNFRLAYAKNAMKAAEDLQLHDAHSVYNDKVRSTLEDIAEK
ncbi:MAG TPA: AHH domain-containing protein, partial [Chitinispirillaceae bacterium]|nr:AHH domain-containing protein [Chitinispirillaceae bacterium]